MLLAVFGLIPFWKQQKGLFPSIGLFLLLFTYITCAWSIWWYGGSFGARAMVQSYAFWLFPMAALAQWILSKRWLSIGFGILCCFFIWHSLWWTHQAHRGGILDLVGANDQPLFLEGIWERKGGPGLADVFG